MGIFDEIQRQFEQETAEIDCAHERTELREKRIANGSLQLRHQCLSCGQSVGNAVSYASAPRGPKKPWDQEAEQGGGTRYGEAYERRSQRRREAYRQYLSSPEWRERRQSVVARANGICEGCGKLPTSEVHHLTYDHVGAEFLFELVALCVPCHERIHSERASKFDPNER